MGRIGRSKITSLRMMVRRIGPLFRCKVSR
jgi:hypothetical protein